ncbi:MAG TPA: hypothetical protein VFJ16_17155 [Longimicrobium sp.]|nr:hypothetical protein [Longimicrobium sp.]
MSRTTRTLLAVSAAVLCTACSDGLTGSGQDDTGLNTAFTSSLLGLGSASTSFGSSTTGGDSAFVPHGDHHGRRGGGRHGPAGDFMGGGFGHDFLGGPLGGGRPFDDHGLQGANCTYSAGVTTCTDTRNGLTVTRTARYLTAAGAAQQAVDSTTNTIITHTTVTGTVTRRDSVTSTVNHTSDRTVSGLAKGSTQRTVNGTSSGSETSSGTNSTGSFTASRTAADSIIGLVVPVADGRPSYPTAGKVIRSMTASLTYAGQSPATRSRREVVTYDGSATAKLEITENGTTKACTLPLPHGRPICS